MKIALVVPGGVDRSGEYRVIPALLALIARLSALDEIHVFALLQEALPGEWELLGARVHNIGARHTKFRAIRAICAEHRRSPFRLIHSIWSGAPGFVAVAAARVLGLPSLVHLGGGELVALRDIEYGGRLTWKGRAREAVVLRAATVVTAASVPMIGMLAGLGIAARRLPLGADLDIWSPREPMRRDAHAPVRLIQAASLNRIKDQATLLRALALLAESGADFEMDIVGEDTLQGEIQALSERYGLSHRVRFRGFLPQRELLPLVERAHLMVVSSRHEAGPLAVLEAAIKGVPCIGTAVGHVAEWAPEAAVAVPVGDAAALARATVELMRNEDRRLQIARAAARRASREDAGYTASSFQAIYRTLATPRSVPASRTDADARP